MRSLGFLSIIWQFSNLYYLSWNSKLYHGIQERNKRRKKNSGWFKLDILEKAMAPHSSTLAWKIPWMEEPGRLQSTGSLRVGHDWATSLSLFTFMYCRRKWQPTPVFLPGEFQGRGSLMGCHLWTRLSDLTAAAAEIKFYQYKFIQR